MPFPESLSHILPIQEDATFIFQTREFSQQNPNSLTSILFRLIFNEDAKGVLLVVYKTSDVDILCISDASFTKYQPFASTQIRVIKIQKGGDIPIGLTDVIEKMKTLQKVSYADNVSSNLTQKLIDNLTQSGVQISQLQTPESFFTLPQSTFPDIKNSAQQAQSYISQSIESILKRFPKIQPEKLFSQLEVIEKSNQFQIFTPLSQKIAITQSFQEGVLAKGFSAIKAGFSALSEIKNSNFMPISITAASTLPYQLSISRMLIICKESEKKQLQLQLDILTKYHEKSIQLIKNNVPVSQILQELSELKTEFTEIKIVNKFSIPAFCGVSQAGVCLKSEMAAHAKEEFGTENSSQKLDENTPILMRSTALLEVAGTAFYASFADCVMPSETQKVSEKSLTSPFNTRNSVNESLRDYYVVKTIAEAVQVQKPVKTIKDDMKTTKVAKNTTVDDSESSESGEVDILAKRREAQARRRMLNERHEELRNLVKQDMQRRLQTQKLICDAENAQTIEIAYKEVEDMPRALEFTKNSVVPGEKMFFFINGRPIVILSSFLHSVTVSGDDKKQIRIKFIAPGQIVGKRELYPQLEVYNEFSFLKELVLETTNFSVVNKIVDRFEKIKQNADKSRKTDSADLYQFAEFDVDFQTPTTLKDFLTTVEPASSQKSLLQIGSNTIGQTLEMRPKFKSAQGGQGRKDQGDLILLENGIKYRYAAAGQAAVEIFFAFRNTRRIFYEKFRDNQHFCVVSILLYKPVRIDEIVVDPGMLKYVVNDPNLHERFTFICSMETQMQLGQGRDREEAEQENQTRAMMKRANQKFEEFFDRMAQVVNEFCQGVTARERNSNIEFVNPIGMISQMSRRTKQLKFMGSVEMKGQQAVYSYDPNFLGVFNGKVQKSLDMNDIQIVVFENVSYSTHNAFQIAFVYKDIRVDPYIIRQIQFHYITEIQDFFTENKVFWCELNDSCVWAEMRKRFNNSREEYEQFVVDGGWITEFGLNSDGEEGEEQDDDEDAYTVDEGDEEGDEEVASAYESENVQESDGSESVYDWSRSED